MKTKTTILLNGVEIIVPKRKVYKDVPTIAQIVKQLRKDLVNFNYIYNTYAIAEEGTIGRHRIKVIVEVVKSGQNK